MNIKIGYLLLSVGILTIVGSTVNLVLVLTGNTEPISFYSPESINFDISSLIPSYNIPGVSDPTINQPANTISPEVIAQFLNFLLHIFLVGFLINVGFKIATIGTQLVRPIVVKVKKTEQVISPKNT